MQFYTIGCFGSTETEFFDKLRRNDIDTFLDIRKRRGVRGAEYAFVNSNRLQTKLAELGITYKYISELAAPDEIRELQKRIDQQKGEKMRERQGLGDIFVTEYKKQVLNLFDYTDFLKELEKSGAKKIVLFCVEENPEACHRSIVTKELNLQHGYSIINL